MKKIIKSAVLLLIVLSVTFISAYATEQTEAKREETAEQAPRVKALSVSAYPAKTIYDAFEVIDLSGLTLRALLEDGTSKILSHDEIMVSYQRDTCFRVGDSYATLWYGGHGVSVPVTVNRVEYDLSALEIADFSVTYNGHFNSFETPFPDIVGLDGVPLRVIVRGGGESVGKYDVSIDFETASRDYYTPKSKGITMTVEPFYADTVWENLSFIYDGKNKLPRAYFIDVFGNKIYPEAIGSAAAVGDNYVAKVVFNDPNYVLKNTEARFEIKKADYVFDEVVWSLDSFVYDGSEKSISLTGLPNGVRVVGYVGDRATNAGKYTVTARLSWEEENYNAPELLTHTWEILPASYDISGFKFNPGEFVYDGKMHYPTLEGKMPTGADGITLEYGFSEGACHVSDGTVSTQIYFSTKSRNYKLPEPIYSSVTVTPLGIEVVWGECELIYSGENQVPIATSSECLIKVRGEALDVGRYTAEAYSENADYKVINSLTDYSIKKSDNRWIHIPKNSITYEGRPQAFAAVARFGEVNYGFYKDREGKLPIAFPTSSGKYYARAVVVGTENYSGIESEIFEFEVVKVEAVAIFANLIKTDLRAFEKLSDTDFVCTVVNNDGSRETVDADQVTVKYQNGDSLRKKDSFVTFNYNGLNFKAEVNVDFADYNLGTVTWLDTESVYDGTPKTPILSGLPMGVSVREYVGGGAINAGEYTVSALLDYDDENYNEPVVLPTSLIIKKRVVDLPRLTSVYDGTFLVPKSDSDLYIVDTYESFKNVGNYEIKISLTDDKNYEFKGGAASADAAFEIKPRVITVNVEPMKLFLFEKVGEVDYSVVSGEFAKGDAPIMSHRIEGKRAYIITEDKNYDVVSLGGEIRRLSYPSPLFITIFSLVLVALLLLTLLVYYTLIKNGKFENSIAILKCRFRNRGLSVQPPRPFKRESFEDKSDTKNDSTVESNSRKEDESEENEDGEAAQNTDVADENEPEKADSAELESEADSADEKKFGIDAVRADELITDSLAKDLINRDGEIIYTEGRSKNIVNVDTLNENFSSGDKVDVNALKNKSLVPYDTAYIKILSRGVIDKPLSVYANDFSLSAVKMIALSGGEAIKAVTVRVKRTNEKKRIKR